MGPAVFIMAILGCGEADVDCRQVAMVDSSYASLDACNAATIGEVERRLDAAYPVVVAQCRRADAAAAQPVNSADVDLPEADFDQPVRRASYTPAQSRG